MVDDLIECGVDFQRDEQGRLAFTREGGHSKNRIVFHKDITGREITSKLLDKVRRLSNVEIYEHTALLDIVSSGNACLGAVIRTQEGKTEVVSARYTVLATGGIGGLFKRSTNYRHLTGDAVAIAIKHGVKLKNIDYIQIHPTTLYSPHSSDRSFLISESVRGEGAKLYDKNMKRFVNELLPRDQLTAAIYEQMRKDGTEHVWEDLRTIPIEELKSHFPNIVAHCSKMGYDVTKECIPVVPAQHYFMGGIKVDYNSKTSMDRLYAIGETACNGVHGKNRLASNSLLESLVFAKRAASDMQYNMSSATGQACVQAQDLAEYEDIEALTERYRRLIENELAAAGRADILE